MYHKLGCNKYSKIYPLADICKTLKTCRAAGLRSRVSGGVQHPPAGLGTCFPHPGAVVKKTPANVDAFV